DGRRTAAGAPDPGTAGQPGAGRGRRVGGRVGRGRDRPAVPARRHRGRGAADDVARLRGGGQHVAQSAAHAADVYGHRRPGRVHVVVGEGGDDAPVVVV